MASYGKGKWGVVNELNNAKAADHQIDCIRCDDRIIQLLKDVADTFNDHFMNVTPLLAATIDFAQTDCHANLVTGSNHTCYTKKPI